MKPSVSVLHILVVCCEWTQTHFRNKEAINDLYWWSWHHEITIKRQADRLYPPDYFLEGQLEPYGLHSHAGPENE